MHVTVYDRQDHFVRTIPESQLLVFVHTDELNGADSVQISTLSPLYQGERLVWVDSLGVAHEHVCQNPKATRELGVPIYSDTALNSICDMFGDIIEDYNASGQALGVAFQHVIDATRFEGACTATGTMPAKTDFSGKTARECLRECLKVAGELETRIEVTDGHITRRICNITPRRGHTSSHKRFTYGKDLTKIERTEHSSVITACYGYGKQLEKPKAPKPPRKIKDKSKASSRRAETLYKRLYRLKTKLTYSTDYDEQVRNGFYGEIATLTARVVEVPNLGVDEEQKISKLKASELNIIDLEERIRKSKIKKPRKRKRK